MLQEARKLFEEYGLQIAEEKIQQIEPWLYLGQKISASIIQPQKVQIRWYSLNTLNDFQKLLGDINWLRPSTGIPTYQLTNLFRILEGSLDLNSPRQLIPEAEVELQLIEQQIQAGQLDRIKSLQNLKVLIIHTTHSPTGILIQDTNIIEWVFLPHKSSKKLTTYLQKICLLIEKARIRLQQLCGQDPDEIIIPFSKQQQDIHWQLSDDWQRAFSNFMEKIHNIYPKDKRIQFLKKGLNGFY